MSTEKFAQFCGVMYNIYLNFKNYIFNIINVGNIYIYIYVMFNIMFFLELKISCIIFE